MLKNADALFTQMVGVVADFDEATGLGVVMSNSGAGIPFHCISIADGTRTISPGTRVRYEAVFRTKRVEAINLVNL